MYFLAQHAIVFSNLHTTVEGFWLKRANFLDSLPEIATLVGVAIVQDLQRYMSPMRMSNMTLMILVLLRTMKPVSFG